MNILFLVPAPNNVSPSQRFRFEHYLPYGPEYQLNFVEKSFFSSATWEILHQKKHFFKKITGIAGGFVKRFLTLFTLGKYDYVYIHREAAPVGPPVFEWLIAKVFRKKIIYDFDDAIWISMASESNPGVAGLKCSWKVANICRMSYIVTVGNDFLGDYARQYCSDVRLIPTVVNTKTHHNKIKDHSDLPIVIGWTGTFTNFANLGKVTPLIAKLKEKYDFNFLIIADKDPCFTDVAYTYQKWQLESEIADLLRIHIGLMPLENTDVELGKCAFKAIQYMSLGIPAVVSPVGANRVVVQHYVNGIWVNTETEWYNAIEMLLNDEKLRREMGLKARAHIVAHYSVEATRELFFSLFSK